MSQSYLIRRASIEDAEAIAHVGVTSWLTTYPGIVPKEHLEKLSVEKRAGRWREVLAAGKPRTHVLVVQLSSGEIVGFSDGGPNQTDGTPYDGELGAIYLLANFQKQGIGKALFMKTVEALRSDGFTSVLFGFLRKIALATFTNTWAVWCVEKSMSIFLERRCSKLHTAGTSCLIHDPPASATASVHAADYRAAG